jgi:hypothetical protein
MNKLDFVCLLTALIIALSYIFRRFEVVQHQTLRSQQNIPFINHCKVPKVAVKTLHLSRKTQLCSTISSRQQANTCVGISNVEGRGLFANKNINCGNNIIIALDFNETGSITWFGLPKVTPAAKYLNHCPIQYNTELVPEIHSTPSFKSFGETSTRTGRWILKTNRNVRKGEELTVDYNNLPWFIYQPNPFWKCTKLQNKNRI